MKSCHMTNIAKAWFPYGRKHVVTVVEIDSFSISMTFTTLLRLIHDHMETRLKTIVSGYGIKSELIKPNHSLAYLQ